MTHRRNANMAVGTSRMFLGFISYLWRN